MDALGIFMCPWLAKLPKQGLSPNAGQFDAHVRLDVSDLRSPRQL